MAQNDLAMRARGTGELLHHLVQLVAVLLHAGAYPVHARQALPLQVRPRCHVFCEHGCVSITAHMVAHLFSREPRQPCLGMCRAWFELPLLPGVPLEPYLKIFFTSVGIFGELWLGQKTFT